VSLGVLVELSHSTEREASEACCRRRRGLPRSTFVVSNTNVKTTPTESLAPPAGGRSDGYVRKEVPLRIAAAGSCPGASLGDFADVQGIILKEEQQAHETRRAAGSGWVRAVRVVLAAVLLPCLSRKQLCTPHRNQPAHLPIRAATNRTAAPAAPASRPPPRRGPSSRASTTPASTRPPSASWQRPPSRPRWGRCGCWGRRWSCSGGSWTRRGGGCRCAGGWRSDWSAYGSAEPPGRGAVFVCVKGCKLFTAPITQLTLLL
jgi:hypothetical protein